MDVGELVLHPGASLIGWTDATAGASAETLELSPLLATAADSPLGRRLARGRSFTVKPDERGFFQFTSIPAGSYRLVATRKGFSTAEYGPVAIEPDQEVELPDPLSLERLASLMVWLQPPIDPDREPWQVSLHRLQVGHAESVEVAEAAVDPAGEWSAQGLETGVYEFLVRSSRGDLHHREQVRVTPSLGPLLVDLPAVEVIGTLRYGSEGAPGVLDFKDPRGASIRFEADEAGEFSGVLPRAGSWRVELFESEARRHRRLLDGVEVERGEGGKAHVEIELADTRLRGRVVNGRGEPESPCLVTVHRDQRLDTQVRCEDDATFEIRGLDPGMLQLQAEGHSGRGPFELYELRAGQETEVELQVRRQRTLQGAVYWQGRPVPGALFRYQDPQGFSRGGRATANVDGRVRLTLQHETQVLEVVVISPGMPRKLARVDVSSERPFRIDVGPVAGTLQIDSALVDRSRATLVYQGQPMPLFKVLNLPNDFYTILDPNTGIFSLPMEPGWFELCASAQRSKCWSGELQPAGVLFLGPSASSGSEDEVATVEI